MGGQKSKPKKQSFGSQEPARLGASSLDLIYIDDYFSKTRYLKQLEKSKTKQTGKGHNLKISTVSDSQLQKFQTTKKPPPRSAPKPTIVPSRSITPERSKLEPAPSAVPSRATTPERSTTPELSKPVPNSTQSSKSMSVLPKSPKQVIPPPARTIPSSSVSADGIPQSSTTQTSLPYTEKMVQTSSCCAGIFGSSRRSSSSLAPRDTTLEDKPTKIGDQASQQKTTVTVNLEQFPNKNRKKRSTFTASGSVEPPPGEKQVSPHLYRSPNGPWSVDNVSTSRNRKGDSLRPSSSVGRNWAPASSNDRPKTVTKSTTPVIEEKYSGSNEDHHQPAKRKLVVRGLKNFVNTHKASCPPLWKREFPCKSRFHPDNYIYEWNEGPKAPPRPISAMAKCRRHGGRCDTCGIFTSDICPLCRKCELDCCCPKPPSGCPNIYSEAFGDGWKKTCKVLCDLTENDKGNPVGGTASKRRQNCCNSNNIQHNNPLYQSQIDVLNPYNIPLNENNYCNYPCALPPSYPMCPYPPPMMPFMHPLSYMPMPIPMMPPSVPYFPPPLGLGDPYASPYPPLDSFIPIQNY